MIVGSSHGHLGVIAINFGNNSQSVSTGSFHSTKLASSSCVRNFTLSRNGSHLLITTSDKVLRYSDIIKEGQMLEVKQQGELQDIVNKPQWQCAQFSGNADFIAAATAGKSEHKIYIWNRTFGNLVSILSGPKEGIENILWHPTLPLIAVMSSGGKVQLWTKTPSENWSAYAPDFEELDRNVVYEEKEDEFDNVIIFSFIFKSNS